MARPFPDAALPLLLDWLLRSDSSANESLWCRLFKNNVTPGRDTVTADLVEADFPGYVQKLLNRGSWSPAIESLGVAISVLAGGPFEWVPTASGQVVYGVYLVGGVSGLLYSAMRFSTPRTMADGVTFRAAPTFTLQSMNGG